MTTTETEPLESVEMALAERFGVPRGEVAGLRSEATGRRESARTRREAEEARTTQNAANTRGFRALATASTRGRTRQLPSFVVTGFGRR